MRRKPENILTTELCSYGCGNTAKFKNTSHKLMCDYSSSKCPINREKNSAGLARAFQNGTRVSAKAQYESLPQETKDKMAWSRGNRHADFTLDGKGSHKLLLLRERGHQCEKCGLSEWLDNPIPLELEHSDGNNKNNTKENLLLLCPNCHATTPFYRGKNISNHGKKKVSDDLIIEQLLKGLNNRQVLLNVGLTPKGGNYNRVNQLRFSLQSNYPDDTLEDGTS